MNIKEVREGLGWSQKRLASELGVSRVTVARWETGTRKPSEEIKAKLNEIVTFNCNQSENVTTQIVTSNKNVTSSGYNSESVTSNCNQTEEIVTSEQEIVTTKSDEVVTSKSEIVTSEQEIVTTKSDEVVTSKSDNVTSNQEIVTSEQEIVTSEIDTLEYFNTAYQGTQGYIVLCAIPPEGGNLLIKGIYRTDRLSDMLNKAEALNGKFHLYTNIHPLRSRPQRGRGKESDILGVCLFAADVDAKDFIEDPAEKEKAIKEKGEYKWTSDLLSECKAKALTSIRDVCDRAEVQPSAIIDSGHGFYPIFLLDHFIEFEDDRHREDLKVINKALHKALSADATFDFARILRIPGTRNLKPGSKADCKLIEFHPDRRYTIDYIRKFGKLTTEPSLKLSNSAKPTAETEVTEQDQFYGYKDGVWKILTDGYVEKAIRDLIRPKLTDWDTQAKRNEVLSALKDHLTSWESRDRFDTGVNPDLKMINVSNGMLDWKTGELKSHDKSYYSTCQLNVTYDPEAKSELWERCLTQWIPDPKSRLFMQEFSGYCLIPDTKYHRAVILIGAGKNGKSTFLYTIENLFGKDNLSSIPMKKLSERFEIAQIQHKLVNICADIDTGYIEETSNIKKIISGDTLRGELKYKPSFDFTPITRLWFSCNEIPKASDRSSAWYRRFEYVTFPNRFEGDDQDSQLKYKLTTRVARSAVLNWSIEGLRRLEKQGDFTISDLMTETKEMYELENDNVAAFIDEMIEFPVDVSVPKSWLYLQYQKYSKDSGTKYISRKRFVARIKANGFEEKKTSVKVCSLHHNFRCKETDKYGNYICESDSYEYMARHCFYGMDFEK